MYGEQPGGIVEIRKAEAVAVQRRGPHKGEFKRGLIGCSGRLAVEESER